MNDYHTLLKYTKLRRVITLQEANDKVYLKDTETGKRTLLGRAKDGPFKLYYHKKRQCVGTTRGPGKFCDDLFKEKDKEKEKTVTKADKDKENKEKPVIKEKDKSKAKDKEPEKGKVASMERIEAFYKSSKSWRSSSRTSQASGSNPESPRADATVKPKLESKIDSPAPAGPKSKPKESTVEDMDVEEEAEETVPPSEAVVPPADIEEAPLAPDMMNEEGWQTIWWQTDVEASIHST